MNQIGAYLEARNELDYVEHTVDPINSRQKYDASGSSDLYRTYTDFWFDSRRQEHTVEELSVFTGSTCALPSELRED